MSLKHQLCCLGIGDYSTSRLLTADFKHLILAVHQALLLRHLGTLALWNVTGDYHLSWLTPPRNLKLVA